MKHFFFTIGSDPELFLQDKQTSKYISAVGKIGGTKARPKPIDFDGNCIQEDNVAVEFNTAVAKNALQFQNMVQKNLSVINQLLPNYKISTESAVSFPEEELNTPEAHRFGCEPDYNAWTGKKNPKPFAEDPNLRSAGGHIHIGCELAQRKREEVVRACDLFLGVPSVILDPNPTRRQLYGKAGAYRKKQFGVEYRTLSNFWIFKPETIDWVFTQTSKALLFVQEGLSIKPYHENIIQDCINNSYEPNVFLLNEIYGIYDL